MSEQSFDQVFDHVLIKYRRRWWRWLTSPSWREMAFIDAVHQASIYHNRTYRLQLPVQKDAVADLSSDHFGL